MILIDLILEQIQTCPACGCKDGDLLGNMDNDEERLFFFKCGNESECQDKWRIYFNMDESFEVTLALIGSDDFYNQFPEV